MTKLTPEDVGLIVAMVESRNAALRQLRAEKKAHEIEVERIKFAIRREAALSYKVIAQKFDVSTSAVEHIVSGEAWPQGGVA